MKLLFLLLIPLVLSACDFKSPFGGEKPDYINPVNCPENSREIIFKYDIKFLHSCTETPSTYNSEEATLVTITKGPAKDCSTKCVYETHQYLMTRTEGILPQGKT